MSIAHPTSKGMHAVIAQRTIAVRRTFIVCRTHHAHAHAAARCAGDAGSTGTVCACMQAHTFPRMQHQPGCVALTRGFDLSRLQHRVPALPSPSQNVVRQGAIQSVPGSNLICRAAAASPTAAPGDFVEVLLCHLCMSAELLFWQHGLIRDPAGIGHSIMAQRRKLCHTICASSTTCCGRTGSLHWQAGERGGV